MSTLRRFLALSLSLTAALSRASHFAAPQVIVANGGPLKQRVVLSDFEENHRLMLATTEQASVPPDSLRQRPRIRVAMYWGFHWKGRLDLPDSVGLLTSANGAQPGAFYPAARGQPAIWVFGVSAGGPASARQITAEGLAILKRHQIPIAIR
jgi:hypothetical protein